MPVAAFSLLKLEEICVIIRRSMFQFGTTQSTIVRGNDTMSASSKKKIRKEQNAAALTEKQLKEKVEAKKLKITSVVFAVLMILILTFSLTMLIIKGVQGSGIIEKNTTAVTIGDHKINNLVMSYYYTDTINNTYNEWTNTYGESTNMYLSLTQA